MSSAGTSSTNGSQGDVSQAIRAILDRQKQANISEGPPSAEVRIDRIDRAIGLMVDFRHEIAEAISSDFGHRSSESSQFADVMSSIMALKGAKKKVRRWMKTEKRSPGFPLNLFGAKARIEYQPLGVVGVISPWNFPVNLTFTPLADIFAAGNRVMIKPSEFTPATSELMARMFRQAYDETEVAVITGGPEVGGAFSAQPFDHLLFTGATSIARHVMRAASENLVPVTLELGGKSPVIVSETADMNMVSTRVMAGKTMNAGQICLAPDYVMVPEGKVQSFVSSATDAVAKMYPTLKDNPDYTSVINQRHFDRLQGYLEDAKAKGAEIVEINPAKEDFDQQPHHKIPPTLILNPTEDMQVMQEEIFGPILPVKTYKAMDEVVGYINDHERPLGLYYFGDDKQEERKILDRTTAGGVTINDVVMHVAVEDLPFGGVGPSGMGSYHGYDGFKNFSHAKSIFTAPKSDMVGAMMRPPFTDKTTGMLNGQIKR